MTERTKAPSRGSSPEINARLESHEAKRYASILEQIAQRQHAFETAFDGFVRGFTRHQAQFDQAISKRLDDQDVAVVSISRAVGVDEKHIPGALVKRSLPPPPRPGEEPQAPQKPILPAAARYTRIALVFLVFETLHEGFLLLNRFLSP